MIDVGSESLFGFQLPSVLLNHSLLALLGQASDLKLVHDSCGLLLPPLHPRWFVPLGPSLSRSFAPSVC
jgi:hypothetical protein